MSAQPAKLTDRFLAFLLDLAPFAAGYYFSVWLLVARLGRLPHGSASWVRIAGVWVGLYLLYQALGNVAGATLGKRLLGLRVAALDGSPLGPRRGLVRAFGYLLSMPLMNLGFLWSLWQPQSRAWHDLLAGSVVLEARPRSQAASLASAVASLAILASLLVFDAWAMLFRRTPADLEAVRKAQEGLRILAAIQEVHRSGHGAYTDQLADLARASGDVAAFKEAMGQLFDPDGFELAADRGRYWIKGRARDRRRTEVSLEGPQK